MLGIIGAMDKEIQDLLQDMQDVKERQTGYAKYYEGTLHGLRLCLARCGIGKVHAALCAQGMLFLHPDIRAILNIGVAGALRPALNIGDIVIARSAVQHDMDTTPIGDPPGLISGPNVVHMPVHAEASARLRKAAERLGFRAVTAAIATGDQFIEHLEDKQRIARDFGAAACDMEGGAIAQVAMTAQVPYAAYRAISDTLRGNGQEYALNADKAAAASARLLTEFLYDFKEVPYEL